MVEKISNSAAVQDIILFDGVCNLCNNAVNFIIDRDPSGRYKFASLQSDAGQQLLKRYGLPTDEFNSLVLIRGNRFFTKSRGALEISRFLSGLWSFFYIFRWVPYPIRDFIYNLVARYRYRIFGRSNQCRYPTVELKSRFLDN